MSELEDCRSCQGKGTTRAREFNNKGVLVSEHDVECVACAGVGVTVAKQDTVQMQCALNFLVQCTPDDHPCRVCPNAPDHVRVGG